MRNRYTWITHSVLSFFLCHHCVRLGRCYQARLPPTFDLLDCSRVTEGGQTALKIDSANPSLVFRSIFSTHKNVTMAAPEERHENSMMETLPVDALSHSLLFMDIPTRIKLASLNKTMQRRVYEECKQAWATIDSYSLYPFQESLSDLDLSRLLEKVNAREITKILDLYHCEKLRGNGLTPLRNSRVSETVDLRWTEADRDPMPFLTILRSSIPYNLTDVTLVHYEEGFKSDAFKEFISSLREAQSKRAQEQGTVCASCQQRAQERTSHGLPMSCCSAVKRCSADGPSARRMCGNVTIAA